MILQQLKKLLPRRQYDILRLVDSVESEMASRVPAEWLWICDLDKTYLETAFESVMDLARTAMERPGDKVTVQGAKDTLNFFKWSLSGRREAEHPKEFASNRQLHFISSSPPQLRAVISEKLQMDGLYWESMTLKDQLYNLKQRQPQRLRDHVSYKLLAIAQVLQRQVSAAKVILAGDYAEFDAFIYLVLAFYYAKKPPFETFKQIVQLACGGDETAQVVWELLEKSPDHTVKHVFMRNLPAYQPVFQLPLTGGFWLFAGFEQVASCLYMHSLINAKEFLDILNRLDFWQASKRDDLGRRLVENAIYNGEPLASLMTLQQVLCDFCQRDKLLFSEKQLLSWQAYPSRALQDSFTELDVRNVVAEFGSFYLNLARKRHRHPGG